MSAGSKLKFLPSFRILLILCQMAEFLSLKKNQQVSCSSTISRIWTCELQMVLLNVDGRILLCACFCITTGGTSEGRKQTLFCVLAVSKLGLTSKVYFSIWIPTKVLAQEGSYVPSSIPSVKACSPCINLLFHWSAAREQGACACVQLPLCYEVLCTFPLLPLPVVQVKDSLLDGCLWKWKLMYVQLFTLSQKPCLTSNKSLFSPRALFPHMQCGNA